MVHVSVLVLLEYQGRGDWLVQVGIIYDWLTQYNTYLSLIGAGGADRHSLLEMSKNETLLEQIVRQAQHVVLRLRTIFVLDTLAREFKDPLLTSHWSTLSSPTCSSVKVSIVSAGKYSLLIGST